MENKAWRLDVYQVVDGTDDFPMINTLYGATPQECEDAAEDLYGPNADDKHWTTAYES